MSLQEIVWRIGRFVHIQIERSGFGMAYRPPRPNGRTGRAWLDVLPIGFDRTRYQAAADRILSGRFDIFTLRDIHLGFPPRWNYDPKSGIEGPLLFGKALDYRAESLVGDIKYLWEPNRHLQLTTVAQTFHLTGDMRYAKGVQFLLESWFEQCPYPLGPNWTSALEQAVRLVNWSFVWHLLGGDNSPLFSSVSGQAFRQRWLKSIYQHMHFIRSYLSHFSSANNHLIGEYMGLFIGVATWPLWKDCSYWRDIARDGLETEALKQNAPDGVNREQSTWYHHEVADMMLLCGLIGRGNDAEFSQSYWDRLMTMLEYIASVMDVEGNVPMIGDSDDAIMVRLSQERHFCAYRSLLASGAVLFNRGDFKAKVRCFDEKSRWLLGDDAARRFEELPVSDTQLPVRRAFPQGGYYILGDKFETDEEIRLVTDAGPLGYLSIAAHGHADALSFTFSAYGSEVLVDTGTYSYHTQKKWREYFRGTSAHNTVRVDGENQSVSGGNFLWLTHARGRCETFVIEPSRDEWEASHDGYLRLPGSIRHRRTITFEKQSRIIEVTDKLEGNGQHRVEWFWHFAEEYDVFLKGNTVVARNERLTLSLIAPEGVCIRVERGAEDPPLGWISRHFDEKVPINTVVCEGEMKVGVPARTLLRIKRN
jgi:hypothetical protein